MEALSLGLLIGIAAGVSPGPLLVLVLRATLRRGFAAGARLAAAPLLTDLPIVVAALWIAGAMPRAFLPWMTVAGGGFVVFLGILTCRDAATEGGAGRDAESFLGRDPAAASAAGRRELIEGALVNISSPHPWLFWLGVGGPRTLALWRSEHSAAPLLAAAFLFLFYLGLVGSKVVLAALFARGRKHFAPGGSAYRRLLAACGLALLVMGAMLAWSGLGELGLVGNGA
ncbi:MAG: LysE family transporter [Holophagales bacterium]|nr:LysE family transporter [Holophagales bacterium]